MARNPGEVLVKFLGDDSHLRRTIDSAGSNLSKVGDKFQAAGQKMTTAGLKMSAAVTLPIVAAGKVMFDAASDLEESASKVRVVFGDQAKAVEQFSKNAAKNMGISTQAALEATGTFGNLFRAMGMGTSQSSGMSQALVLLSSDLASFNNANPEDVLLALRSGLVGETEPLREFGVNLSAARIEAEALMMGLAKAPVNMLKVKEATMKVEAATKKVAEATKEHGAESEQAKKALLAQEKAQAALDKAMEGGKVELSAAQKAQAAYSLIMKDTTLAQGDFARTADGAANKQRILKAQFQDAAATLGQQLLPVGIKLLEWVQGLIAKFSELSPTTQKMILIGAGLLAVVGPLVTVVGALVTAIGFLLSPIGLVVVAIAALVAGFIWAYNNIDWFRGAVDAVVRAVVGYFNTLRDHATTVWDGIVAGVRFLVAAIKPPLEGLISYWKFVFNTIATIWNNTVGRLSFEVPSWVPGIGGKGFSMPKIPKLAEGGVVTGPTVALIGEAGPEAVVPLDRAGGFGGNVTINFNGVTTREAAEQVVRVLEDHFDRGGRLRDGRGGSLRPA